MTMTHFCLSSRHHMNLESVSSHHLVFLIFFSYFTRLSVIHPEVIRSSKKMMSIFRLAHLTAEQIQLDWLRLAHAGLVHRLFILPRACLHAWCSLTEWALSTVPPSHSPSSPVRSSLTHRTSSSQDSSRECVATEQHVPSAETGKAHRGLDGGAADHGYSWADWTGRTGVGVLLDSSVGDLYPQRSGSR